MLQRNCSPILPAGLQEPIELRGSQESDDPWYRAVLTGMTTDFRISVSAAKPRSTTIEGLAIAGSFRVADNGTEGYHSSRRLLCARCLSYLFPHRPHSEQNCRSPPDLRHLSVTKLQ